MARRDRPDLLLLVPVAIASAVAVVVLRTWAVRVGHPYDLEWMEGGVLVHAWRVLHGEPIYVAPGPDFIPMVYTPGYYWVVAAIGAVTGLTPATGRLVSVAGTLLACAALVWGAHRRLGRAALGVIGAGLYLATYDDDGAFFDLVRPDALAVGLLAWALVLAAETGTRRRPIVGAGVVLFLAFVVKHNMAALGVPIALGVLVRRGWRDALLFALVAAVPGALFTAAMQATTDGHFLRYVIEVPRSHPLVWDRVVPGTLRETGHALPLVLAALVAWCLTLGPRVAPKLGVVGHVLPTALAGAAAIAWLRVMPPVAGIPRETPFEGAVAYAFVGVGLMMLALGLIGSALDRRLHGAFVYGVGVVTVTALVAGLMRGHHGGFVNVFMPLHWVLAAAFTVMLADVLDALPGWRGATIAMALATTALGVQLATLELGRLVPTEADVAAGDEIVAALREREGPMLSVFAPWMPVQAGHRPGFHLIALWDINHEGGPYRSEVPAITRAVQQHHWQTIVDGQPSFGHDVPKAYERAETFDFPPRVLMPRTGWRRRPEVIWAAPNPTADRARVELR